MYHENCPDGFGAAWSAWRKFGIRANYEAISPREAPKRNTLRNKEIYVLDNSLAASVIKRLEEAGNRVVIIDHHFSSEKDVKSAKEYVFDTSHSGAVLSWKYFHPKKKIPRLLAYIEDGDLWLHKLPNSKYFLSYLYAQPFDFKKWNKLARDMETNAGRRACLEKGKVISEYRDALIEREVNRASLVFFEGRRILAVNSSLKIIRSDVGNVLLKKKPPMSVVWGFEGDNVHVSLRSNGKVDVSNIAVRYGGGGHKRAAGFNLSANKSFPWKIIKE